LIAFLRSVPGLELLDVPAGVLLSDATVTTNASVIDVLIFDVYRPDYDNWAALQAIRSRLSTAYCIMLVGSPQQMSGAQTVGVDHMLLAGFSAMEFFEVLHLL
jgi:DNA-binding NarL/FixJ family response regulator